MKKNDTKQGKTAAIVSYITVFGLVFSFFLNMDSRNTFAYFHMRQALGLHLTNFLLIALANTFNSTMTAYAFYTFYLVLLIYGLVGAIREEENEVPLLGAHCQKYLTFIG